VVAKTSINKFPRGWQYLGSNLFQTDHACAQETLAQVLSHASVETPVTFTVVPAGNGRRIGVDHNENGLLDFDETTGLFRITAIALQGHDVLVSWTPAGGTTNRLQVATGTINFTDVSPPINCACGVTATNYLDVGVATNFTA